MKNHFKFMLSWSLIGLGIAVVMLGLVSLIASTTRPSTTYAQDEDDVEYIGASECSSCHRDLSRSHTESRHALTLQDEAFLADFSKGEDIRTVQFPSEDAPRAFTAEDIAYSVGSGRYVQRYLYEVDRNEYIVLPAEWNVSTQEWQPFILAETWDSNAYSWNTNCAGCHTTGLNAERGKWEDDGVQCEGCHGAGSVHAEEAADAGDDPSDRDLEKVRESIVLSPDAQICGQCHGRGVATEDEFQFPVGYLPGQTLADSYTLAANDDPIHWWTTGHASQQNMQYNEWLTSAHSTSLAAVQETGTTDATCLTCHSTDYLTTQAQIAEVEAGERAGDPPEPLTVETAQNGVTCAGCHQVHSENNPDFLLTQDTYTLCTDCHQNTGESIHHPVKEMYEGLAIVENVEAVPSSHFTSEDGPTCVTCHMSDVPVGSDTRTTHTFQPVLPDGTSENIIPDSCTSCHTDLTPEYISEFIAETQEKTTSRLEGATTALASLPEPPAWIQTALDFVEGDGSEGVHNYAYTDALLDAVEVELGLVQITSAPTAMLSVNPSDCEECHRDEYRQWSASPHANASLTDTFLRDFAAQGRPGYCMSCHGSGYNPDTSSHAFEGVVCTSCHTLQNGAEHPPAPVEIATSSEVCGQCHSGAHAPSYDEWLVSSHNQSGIDCVDCHTPHNNGLVLGDVNATCGSCHQEALTDPVHMGEEMNCVDCHMARKVAEDGVHVLNTGHSMLIDPGVCSDCHGNTHMLSVRETNSINEADVEEVAALQEEVKTLRDDSKDERNSGMVGGALGAFIVMIILGILWRMRIHL